jgi:hypothetical protein
MRKLETSDVFAACRLLKKLGLKEKFKAIAEEANEIRDVFDKGYDLIWDLFDTATEQKSEAEIYVFLAGPLEMTPEEVAHLHLDKLLESLQQMAVENNLVGFFKSAARLMR